MRDRGLNKALQYARRLTLREAGPSDGELLDCVVARQDEAAFAALVQRHGPMVWGVCQRVLGHRQDAEDAFQATFLVLVRKASSIWPRQAVGSWLHGVARRTALKARSSAAKRYAREKPLVNLADIVAAQEQPWRHLEPLLDEEVVRLPEKYRVPLVLCDLQGKTRKQAACELGVPEGTVSSRLATARQMLAKRLARRGLVLSPAALVPLLLPIRSSAQVPTSLVCSTIQAASKFAARPALTTALSPPKSALLRKGC